MPEVTARICLICGAQPTATLTLIGPFQHDPAVSTDYCREHLTRAESNLIPTYVNGDPAYTVDRFPQTVTPR